VPSVSLAINNRNTHVRLELDHVNGVQAAMRVLAQYNIKATGHVAKLRRDLSV
jgi:hypothetical protein